MCRTVDGNRLECHCDPFCPLEWATSHGRLKRREKEAAGTRPLPALPAHHSEPWETLTENEYVFPSIHEQLHLITDTVQHLVLVRMEGWGNFRRKTAGRGKILKKSHNLLIYPRFLNTECWNRSSFQSVPTCELLALLSTAQHSFI